MLTRMGKKTARKRDGKLTVIEAATMLGVSRDTVSRLIGSGVLPAKHIGGLVRKRYLVARIDVEKIKRDNA